MFCCGFYFFFFFSSRRRHTRWTGDWSSDLCSSELRPDCCQVWTHVHALARDPMALDTGDATEVVKNLPAAGHIAIMLEREIEVIGWLHFLRLRFEQPALSRCGVLRVNLL